MRHQRAPSYRLGQGSARTGVLCAGLALIVVTLPAACGGGSPTPTAPSPQITQSRPTFDVDTLGVPPFATSNYIDLAAIRRISRFRSSVGHEWRDEFESCRSMKHYFEPKATVDWGAVRLYSPVEGTVERTQQERVGGLQVAIRSSIQPAFTFIVFHVNPGIGIAPGTPVAAGQPIGTHIGSQTTSDIAVTAQTPRGSKAVSWFEAMSDGVFQEYAARGVVSRASAIITRAERDGDPLTCAGETFTSFGLIAGWLVLN